MPFNGKGQFTLKYTWVNEASAGTPILATHFDDQDSDIAAALSNTITRDGQSTLLANLPMGGFKLSNLGPGTLPGDSVNFGQVFNSPAFVTPTATTSPVISDNPLRLATVGLLLNTAFNTALPLQSRGVLFSDGQTPGFGQSISGFALNAAKGSDIASAATIDLSAPTGEFMHVTGTTTINAITVPVGAMRVLIFDGVLTLKNSGALALPGAADIVTQAGDRVTVRGDTAGTVVVGYTRADGTPLVLPSVNVLGAALGSSYSVPSYAPGMRTLQADTLQAAVGKLQSQLDNGGSFQQTGAGAVARTGQDKLRESITAGDYGSLDQAITAAAGKTLVINSSVAVTANITIPTNVAIEVKMGGMFNVAAGITLTIAGPLTAGEFQIFGGAGSVIFTVTSRAKDLPVWRGGSPTAVFSTARSLLQSPTDVGGPVHAFEDNGTLNFTNPKAANYNAYAAFDANTTASGAGSYDHMVGFQSRQTYNGSNEIWARFDGFNFLGTHSGTGRVAIMRGLHVENPLGTGQIDFLAGVMVENLTRGTETYGFYSATTQNVVSTAAGQPANWLLRGNGQTGGYGMLVQSAGDSTGKVLNTANAPLIFGMNNAEGMRMMGGNLLKIGAPATVLTDNQLVEIQGTGAITLKATGGAGNACSLNWNSDTAGNSLFSVFYTETAATQRGSIDYNRAGGLTRYNTTSDGTMKNVLGDSDVQKSLDILANTRLRNYTWKDDPTGKVQIGPIAQELYETFPGAVSVGGVYTETVDGEPVQKYRAWGVDKTAFTFHLIAGYQHQAKQITELQQQVADLAERLAKLESTSP